MDAYKKAQRALLEFAKENWTLPPNKPEMVEKWNTLRELLEVEYSFGRGWHIKDEAPFNIGDKVDVTCEGNKVTITISVD